LVLENDQGDILLTQRQNNQHLAGYWEFPGGKIKTHESPTEALRRECKEEIDYTLTAADQILQLEHKYPSANIELLVFHEIKTDPKVKPAEGQPMQWVNKKDLLLYKMPEANKTIIQHIQSNRDLCLIRG